MNDTIGQSLLQLAFQAPLLLVYLVGALMALVLWRRHPGPSLLTLIATGLLLVLAVLQPILSHYIFRLQSERGWSGQEISSLLSAVAVGFSLLRALGLALLLVAVFAGRRRA